MTTLEIIEFVVICVAFVTLFGIYFYKAIKNKWLGELMNTVEQAMREAEEKWPEGHGDEKREYVLKALEEKCEELHIPYTIMTSLLTKVIAEIVKHWNILK